MSADGVVVGALDSGLSGLGLSPGHGCCVLEQDTLNGSRNVVVYKRVTANYYSNLTNCSR